MSKPTESAEKPVFPFQDLECPFKHEDIKTLYLYEVIEEKDLPRTCSCGHAITYAPDLEIIIYNPPAPGDYGSMQVSEVKCEAVDLATEGKHRSPFLDFLTGYLPTPRTTIPYGSDPYEDARVKDLEKAMGLDILRTIPFFGKITNFRVSETRDFKPAYELKMREGRLFYGPSLLRELIKPAMEAQVLERTLGLEPPSQESPASQGAEQGLAEKEKKP